MWTPLMSMRRNPVMSNVQLAAHPDAGAAVPDRALDTA